MRVNRWLCSSLVVALALLGTAPAHAHQPVDLGPADATAAKGPLLPDGTVSYAVRASVVNGEQRGFRFRLARGDRLAVQVLILDEPPANAVPTADLPTVTLIDPRGRRTVLAVRERTPFFEPYSGTNYLYLSRVERAALPGEYSVLVRGRSAQIVDTTVAVGYREVPGRVVRQGR